MPIADALRGITGQIERHQGRMTDLAEKRMDIEFQNRQLDRQERNDALAQKSREIEDIKNMAVNEEMARIKTERETKENAPFSLKLPKTNSVPEAIWQADRIMEGNKALSSALGFGAHYDPSSGNVLRDDTGQALPVKAVQPHMQAIQAVTVLNASPRRMLEDKIAAGGVSDQRMKQYQEQLDKYNKDPIGMTTRELLNKQKQFAALAPYLEKNPILLEQAKKGLAQTQKDLDALVKGASEIAKEKRGLLADLAKEDRAKTTKRGDFISQEGYKSDLKEEKELRKMKVTGYQIDEDGMKVPIDAPNMKDIDARIKVLAEKRRIFEGGKPRAEAPAPKEFNPRDGKWHKNPKNPNEEVMWDGKGYMARKATGEKKEPTKDTEPQTRKATTKKTPKGVGEIRQGSGLPNIANVLPFGEQGAKAERELREWLKSQKRKPSTWEQRNK